MILGLTRAMSHLRAAVALSVPDRTEAAQKMLAEVGADLTKVISAAQDFLVREGGNDAL